MLLHDNLQGSQQNSPSNHFDPSKLGSPVKEWRWLHPSAGHLLCCSHKLAPSRRSQYRKTAFIGSLKVALLALALVVAPALSNAQDDFFLLNLNAIPPQGGSIATDPIGSVETGYQGGTVVSLSAIPLPGYQFDEWTGDTMGATTGDINVTMDSEKFVQANFSLIPDTSDPQRFPVKITINPVNGGAVAASPGPNAGNQYNRGTDVMLAATPAAGFTFRGWTGDITSSSPNTEVVVNGPYYITANFSANDGNDSFEPNNTIFTAQDVNVAGPMQEINGLSLNGKEDWYKLNIGPQTHLQITMSYVESAGNINMQLWDRRASAFPVWGYIVGESYDTNGEEVITYVNRTEARVLYLRTYGEQGATNPAYSLLLETVEEDDQFDLNGARNNSACDDLPQLNLDQNYDLLISRDDDYYRFDVRGVNSIDVIVEHEIFSGDLNFMVLPDDPANCENVFNNIIAGGYSSSVLNDFEQLTDIDVSQHDSILVRVYGATYSSTNCYELQVSRSN